MSEVMTVTGPVDANALGITHLHEHLLSDFRCYLPDDSTLWDRSLIELSSYHDHRFGVTTEHNTTLGSRAETMVEIAAFQAAGGNTIVDSTSIGIGRDPEGLRYLAQETGANIIMGSGWYVHFSMPEGFADRTIKDLATEIITDLATGVGDSGIRSGLIGEVGLSWPHHPQELRSLEAACVAQRETGVALQIHPGRHPDSPVTAIRACESWGVDPTRVVMSHVERTLTDLESMIELARTGCVLEFDLFGQESSYYLDPTFTDMPNDAGRIRFIAGLVEAGFGSQIAVSQDICQRTHTAAFGGEGLHHILTRTVPLMKQMGFADEDVFRLLVANPASVLGATS